MARAPKKPELPFPRRLVLNQFMLRQFGFDKFEDLADALRLAPEGLDSDNISRFHHVLVGVLPETAPITPDDLLRYDQNIVRHTLKTQGRRKQPISWKYFQYLGLLFTERYLDRYFASAEKMLDDLNAYVENFNAAIPAGFDEKKSIMPLFVSADLRKLAIWQATGSGKTLIMHVNILQYGHYLDKAGRGRELNRTILLTPNAGLSKQHLAEFQESKLDADLFAKEGGSLFSGKSIEIIEITKLAEESKEKTVAVDAFEGNNLVLIDEGHRGAGGDVWRKMRKRLAADGFAFEYSATFGQAIHAATAKKKTELAEEYGKAILFDYSYRYFYHDGYGKDYRILNLADDSDEETRRLYLTACLLTFFQQIYIHRDPMGEAAKFLIENPLWIFVGNKVTAVRTENKRQVSDVIDILLFLAEFVKEKRRSIEYLERLKSGAPGLPDSKGREIFSNSFTFLTDHFKTAGALYDDIVQTVFNAAGPAALHVEELKGADGEIALRLGENEPFGLINVGDASTLTKLCKEHDELVVTERQFSGSLFQSINDKDSHINILIGSKKFSEGWSSWRVSTMGLMNVGKSEGSEVIQLFGRGVRLKGLDFTLKRHTAPGMNVKHNEYLKQLETLCVFGIRAKYMEDFKSYLEAEGLPDDEPEEIILPVIKNLGTQRLKTIKLKAGIDFKRDGENPDFGELPTEFLKRKNVTVNWYPRLQAMKSDGASGGERGADMNMASFEEKHTAFLDFDALYFEMQDFKAQRNWFNLNLSRPAISKLLLDASWYTLYIAQDEMALNGFDRIGRLQEIASSLLKKYCERYYAFRKQEFEAPHLEYRILSEDDPNFINEYRCLIDRSQTDIIAALGDIKAKISDGEYTDIQFPHGMSICFGQHLYQPLLHLSGDEMEVRPVALNKGEKQFVTDLRTYYEGHATDFEGQELYLLRNLSRGKGVGFFEAGNFYPDFLMWLVTNDKQYVSFIDPKGIRNLEGENDPKIRFSETIKEIEQRLADPDVELNSFIISNTPLEQVKWWKGGMTREDFERRHVLFQTDGPSIYIGQMIRMLSS